jgi:pimeloyl-ACP methyl ester carboxylesterase
MGGILMMLHAIDHPDAPIERFVGVGSALDYRPGESVFRKLRPLRPLAGSWLQTFPFARLGQLNGLVSGYGPTFPAEQMNFVRSNVERSVARQILMRGFDDISMRLFDDLDTTFQDQGFSRKHGALHYLSRAKDFRLATCLIAGSRDVQATPEAIDATVQLLSGARILEVVRRGKLYGQEDDYGHIDLLVGKRASREVWPTILSFLCGN